MNIVQSHKGDITILALEGRLDATTATELEKVLIPLIDENHTKIIIDFDMLTYISSAGLRLLLMGAKKLSTYKSKLVLCSLKNFIKEIFEIAGFLPLFTVCTTREQSISTLS